MAEDFYLGAQDRRRCRDIESEVRSLKNLRMRCRRGRRKSSDVGNRYLRRKDRAAAGLRDGDDGWAAYRILANKHHRLPEVDSADHERLPNQRVDISLVVGAGERAWLSLDGEDGKPDNDRMVRRNGKSKRRRQSGTVRRALRNSEPGPEKGRCDECGTLRGGEMRRVGRRIHRQ